DHRHHQTDTEAKEAGAHRLRLAAKHDGTAMRQGFFRRGENRFDVLEHAAQIAPPDSAEDINYRHDIVVRVNGLTVGAGIRGDVCQQLFVATAGNSSAHRHRVEIGKRSHSIFRRANVQEILNSNAGIEPVCGLHLAAAAQAEQNRTGDVAFGKPQFRSLGPVNRELEALQITRLLNPHVQRSGNMSKFFCNVSGDLLIACQVSSEHLDVVGSGQPEVNGLADDVCREEIKRYARKVAIQGKPQISDVVSRRAVTRVQGDHDVCVGRSGGAAVIIAQVNAGNGNAKVINNSLK